MTLSLAAAENSASNLSCAIPTRRTGTVYIRPPSDRQRRPLFSRQSLTNPTLDDWQAGEGCDHKLRLGIWLNRVGGGIHYPTISKPAAFPASLSPRRSRNTRTTGQYEAATAELHGTLGLSISPGSQREAAGPFRRLFDAPYDADRELQAKEKPPGILRAALNV